MITCDQVIDSAHRALRASQARELWLTCIAGVLFGLLVLLVLFRARGP